MSKFFCNGADSECNCPILCADCTAADWKGGTEIKTNADRIRAMSDEELAVLIAREIVHVPHSGFYVAKSAWLRWLQETVEEQDG